MEGLRERRREAEMGGAKVNGEKGMRVREVEENGGNEVRGREKESE